MVSDNKEIGW